MEKAYRIDIDVRFGDFDVYGHVNNVAYARFLEESRVRFVMQSIEKIYSALGQEAPEGKSGVLGQAFGDDLISVVGSQHIEYLKPFTTFGSSIAIYTWISQVGTSSYTVDYILADINDQDIVYAKAQTVVITLSKTSGKPTEIPQTLKDILEDLIQPALTFR